MAFVVRIMDASSLIILGLTQLFRETVILQMHQERVAVRMLGDTCTCSISKPTPPNRGLRVRYKPIDTRSSDSSMNISKLENFNIEVGVRQRVGNASRRVAGQRGEEPVCHTAQLCHFGYSPR